MTADAGIPDQRIAAAHLNLAHASAQMSALEPEAVMVEEDGLILLAQSHDHPAIANVAFRVDDGADAKGAVARAKGFFGGRGRGFSFFLRGERPEDEDMAVAAGDAGLHHVYEMPQMVLDREAAEPDLPEDARLERITGGEGVRDYWSVTAEAYKSLEFPPELFSLYTDYEGFGADNLAAFVGYLGDEPAAAALTIVTDGAAGIYWVGVLEKARGNGLARAVTAAASNAGLELGGRFVSLQASHMGASLYEDMGFETLFPYRLWMAPPPDAAS